VKVLRVYLAALALAACQKPAATPAGAPTASAPSASPASPQRRAGLWQQSFTRDGRATPMASMRLCVDPTSEARASVFTRGAASQRLADSHCTGMAASRTLSGYSFASTCPMTGGGTVVSKGAASGDFATSYHVHVENDVSGAAYGPMNGHHVTDIDGKWLGPCPAGMAPGDMEIGHGMRISGGKLAGAAAALAGGQ